MELIMMKICRLGWAHQGYEIKFLETSIEQAFRALRYGPRSLNHINLDGLRVIGPSGQHLFVPTMLCLTWEVPIA